jgi:hypothetical protein
MAQEPEMENNEVFFAFVLIPVYLGITYAISRSARMRSASLPIAFAVNWVIAAACLGSYAAATGLAGGQWIGVSLFSGTLAAVLATAVSGKLSLNAATK